MRTCDLCRKEMNRTDVSTADSVEKIINVDLCLNCQLKIKDLVDDIIEAEQ